MSDRELLEMAAKAYWGDEIDDVVWLRWSDEDQSIAFTHGDNQDHNGDDRELLWNPLIDDGDALRLAVKLAIDIEFEGKNVVFADGNYSEFLQPDPVAATRRAIVRAAAEIGKAMP